VILESKQELSQFLAGVERRAFRIAQMATGNTDDALDILQDAMFNLARKYADRPPEEWGALFQTVLQSRIRDFYRRSRIRNRFRAWFGGKDDRDGGPDRMQSMVDESGPRPERDITGEQSVAKIDAAIRALPLRQQQAFMLRVLEGLDTKAAARIMKCSESSVKTHYSRAIHTLRAQLDDLKS